MNRREFVGVSLGFAMSGVLFYTGIQSISAPGVSITTSSTQKIVKVSGTVFFDYDGNGLRGANEPVLSDVGLNLGGKSAITDVNGHYEFHLPAGEYRLTAFREGFRFLSLSNSEFHPSDTGMPVQADGDLDLDLGLMQGFLTLPFKQGTEPASRAYFDDDPRPMRVKDWKGTYITDDGNDGIDYALSYSEVAAAAPGIVVEAAGDWTNNFVPEQGGPSELRGNRVLIYHGNGYFTGYYHLSKVFVRPTRCSETALQSGQLVKRGETIGISGVTGPYNALGQYLPAMKPRLHFSVFEGTETCIDQKPVDPYRRLQTTEPSVSLWTKDNDPQYPRPG